MPKFFPLNPSENDLIVKFLPMKYWIEPEIISFGYFLWSFINISIHPSGNVVSLLIIKIGFLGYSFKAVINLVCKLISVSLKINLILLYFSNKRIDFGKIFISFISFFDKINIIL